MTPVAIVAKIQIQEVPNIAFLATDMANVVPHEDDPIVLSIVLMGRNVHRVSINQGSSTDVMFCYTFLGL